MEYANYLGDKQLHAMAEGVFNDAIEAGWDKEYGGLLILSTARDCRPKPMNTI